MTYKKIKISSIIQNQLPQYIVEEFPLVNEFLSQYYKSTEVDFAPSDLIQNIDEYVKIDNLFNNKENTFLTSDIFSFDTTIFVESTEGFPNSYGLLQIGSEIITYMSKTDTSFEGCIRGFSGITSLNDISSDDQLVFSDTESQDHLAVDNKTKVINLNSIFFKEFLFKIKKQITPGFEDVNLFEGLNQRLFIKQSKDFYRSKGTDYSFEILFGALYGNPVKIIKPRDYLIEPSNAQYRITRNIVLELISGDPSNIVNGTLYQDFDGVLEYSRGTITNLEKIFRNNKEYYVISLDFDYNKDIDVIGSFKNNFKVTPKTIIVSDVNENSNYIDVDSTVSFPESGSLIIETNGLSSTIEYKSKTLNQFLECSNTTEFIPSNTEIKLDTFVYSYTSRDKNIDNIVKFRVTGVLSDLEFSDQTYLSSKNDSIKIKTFGSDLQGLKANNWFFNIPINYNVSSLQSLDDYKYRLVFFDDHSFVVGDKFELSSSNGEKYKGEVIFIEDKKVVLIRSFGLINESPTFSYNIKKQLSKVDIKNYPELNFNNANVQNVYSDLDDNIYVMSPSLPAYINTSLSINDESLIISGFFDNSFDITFKEGHNLLTGDRVVYKNGTGEPITTPGIYFAKKINDTTIRLSRSKQNLFNSQFVSLSGNLTEINDHKLELFSFNDKNLNLKQLQSQRIIRKISEPVNDSFDYETNPGTTGIFINGVELLNYKSNDFIHYGPIEEISVLSKGSGYDVINPPQLNIDDPIGSGCVSHCSVVGSLERIDVIDPGFDYIETPTVRVFGGDGSGIETKVNLISYDHVEKFNPVSGVNTTQNTITFPNSHKFRNYEEVIYNSDGNNDILGLSNNSTYFVSIQNNFTVKLHSKFEDSVNGVRPIILSSTPTGIHLLKSTLKKKKIGSIDVTNKGEGYKNRKILVNSSGISTSLNIFTAKNHGYETGKLIKYYPTDTPISGLSTSTSYYVTKLNENQFKLSQLGIGSIPVDFYFKTNQYVNITSVGTGKHYFNYEPIRVEVEGKIGVASTVNNFKSIVRPIFRGEIDSIFVEDGGKNYGSEEVLNYNRQPLFTIPTGSGVQLKPIINGGKIVDVVIQSSGQNYISVPDIIVNGSGVGCVLTPILSNGSIIDVIISSSGLGYDNTTSIDVIPVGSGAKFESFTKKWTINLVERKIKSSTITDDDGFIFAPPTNKFGLQYTHTYAPRNLRSSVLATKSNGDKIELVEDLKFDNIEIFTNAHSPVIGWSYDGNPIYGPYGFSSSFSDGEIKQLKSGYETKPIEKLNNENRPSLSLYSIGLFVEDYEFIKNGDLDEYNGRFCITPEYPNGVYAYFCTLNELISENIPFNKYKRPAFPYVIGNKFKSKPIEYNFDISSNQVDFDITKTNWVRNTTPYNLVQSNSGYEYFVDFEEQKKKTSNVISISTGSVDNIKILESGDNYKIDDEVVFDDKNYFIDLKAKVNSLKGKKVVDITTEKIEIENIELILGTQSDTFTGIKEDLSELKDGDKITIINPSEISIESEIRLKKPNILTLTLDVLPIENTGIITDFNVSGNLTTELFENDLYQINDEIVKILKIDENNLKITVNRNINDISGIQTYKSGLPLVEKVNKFNTNLTYTNQYNLKRNKELYFSSNKSVGIGTSYGVGITTTKFLGVENFNSKVILEKGNLTTLYFDRLNEKDRYKFNDYINIKNATDSNYNVDKSLVVGIGNTFIQIDYDTSSLSGNSIVAILDKWIISEIPTRTIQIANHGLSLNDNILYNPPQSGNPITILDPQNPSTERALFTDRVLYSLPINDNLIALSDNPFSGNETITDESLFSFVSEGSNDLSVGDIHSFKVIYENKLVVSAIKNIVTVETETDHNLKLDDIVTINCTSNDTQTVSVAYDDYSRRLLIDGISFNQNDIDLESNSFTIQNHNFKTGEKVWHESSTPAEGLIDKKDYYVYVLDQNRIKLVENYFELRKNLPNFVRITSTSFGKLSKVNPSIEVSKFSNLRFDLSDPSLSFSKGVESFSAFEFEVYTDIEFKNQFLSSKKTNRFEVIRGNGKIGISTNAYLQINFNENVPTILYYNLIPIKSLDNSIVKLQYSIDKEQIGYNQINLIDSKYNGTFKVFDTDPNPRKFKFLITKNTEKNSYTNELNSNIEYITTSKNASGPVNSIKVFSNSNLYEYLPSIKQISSENGANCLLEPESKTIGKVNSTRIQDIGFNYLSDNTIRPKFKLPDIIKVNALSIIDQVEVISGGVNYNESPDLILKNANTNQVLDEVLLEYDIRNKKVNVVKNIEGIGNNDLNIIPINNTNGFEIDTISFDAETNIVSLTLSREFSVNDIVDFPFRIGGKILIENTSVGVNTTGIGYNSKNYNYSLFTITGLNSNLGIGKPVITYSLSEYLKDGENPGTYSNIQLKGIVIPESYFPVFSISTKKKDFSIQETVIFSDNGIGIVESWDKNNQLLKVSTSNDIKIGDLIVGKTSKTNAIVERITTFEGFYNINSSSLVKSGWKVETGFLNNQFQRIHDSDYYQYFSYSLKSSIDFNKWKDPVEKLNHTIGFKKFSDLQIESLPLVSSGINTEQNFGSFSGTNNIYREIDLNCVNDFDLVRENIIRIDDSLVSNEIYFENKLVQDYIESVGNKTLIIDDLSSQFNSNPRPTPFSIVDTFDINEFKYKKYFIHVIDKLFTNQSEFSIVSLLQDKKTGYINHYGKVYSDNLIGYFDFRISGIDGELLFYPKKFEINNYNINFFSFDISNILSDKSNISLGNIAKFDLYEETIPPNSINNSIKVVGISSDVRSLKVLVNISTSDDSYSEINELTVIHDGTNAYINEYGLMNNNDGSSLVVGNLGEYNANIDESELSIDFIPRTNFNIPLKVNSSILSINDLNSVGVGTTVIGETIFETNSVSIGSSSSPEKIEIKSFSKDYSSCYMIINVEDSNNNDYQVSELIVLYNPSTDEVYYNEFGNVTTNSTLGNIESEIDGDNIVIYFTPNPDIDCEVRLVDILLGIPTTFNSIQIDKSSISIGYNEYFGTKVDIKKSFYLTSNNNPIFERFLNLSTDINILDNRINIPNHYFSTGEEVIYEYNSKTDTPIGIATTSISGIGLTDVLPKNVYILKYDDNNIQVTSSPSDALSSTPNVLILSGIGTGNSHRFISNKQNTKCLITIDNLIQSPISGTAVTTTLIENLGIVDAFVDIESTDNLFAGNLIKIDNEIMKIVSVGIGSTNTILVERELAGTIAGLHTSGTKITKVKGNYNIVDNFINFLEAPYGKVPILNISGRSDELDYNGLEIGSKFGGRVFLKSGIQNSTDPTYSSNYVLDDISDQFNGIDKEFTLKYETNTNLGSLNSDVIVLINDVFQLPSKKDGSVTIDGDYELIEDEALGISTISFTGNSTFNDYDVNSSSIPRGGLIISIASTQGFGYQPLVSAGGTAIVSIAGTIEAISIGNSGSGYRSGLQSAVNVGVKTEDVIDTNIEIIGTALVQNGNVVGVSITNPGSGYSKLNPPIVVFDDPISYSNIPLIYSNDSQLGFGTGARVDIVVGQGSSVLTFELKNVGFGYEIGDILTVSIGGTVGIPTILGVDYKEFQIIVDEIRNDEFSAWSFGNLQIIDPIENLFDGVRRAFPLKIDGQPRSIRSKPGSGVDVQSSLLVFINDVLQVPGKSYIFNGGSIITFVEPPKGPSNDLQQNGDTCKIIFYTGTPGVDTINVDIPETIKVGDQLEIGGDDIELQQSSRIVEIIKSTDIIGTNLYIKDGISQEELLTRPVKWCKQTEDRFINGEIVTKNRISYEPLIYPRTNVIKKIEIGSTEIFVENIKTFFDNISEDNNLNNEIIVISQKSIVSASATSIVSNNGTISSIEISNGGSGYTTAPSVTISNPTIGIGSTSLSECVANISSGIVTSIDVINSGFGYTSSNPPLVLIESPNVKMENISNVEYEGDFGNIIGISTEVVGGIKNLVFDFYIPNDSFIRDLSVNNVGIATTGISEIKIGYYFSVYNSNVGFGITTLNNNDDVISVGSSYIDGIYEASSVSIASTEVVGIGTTVIVKVTSKVLDFNGLNITGFGSFYGKYSWGRIYNLTRNDAKEFEVFDNGLYNANTSPLIIRKEPLKFRDYI